MNPASSVERATRSRSGPTGRVAAGERSAPARAAHLDRWHPRRSGGGQI